MALNAPYTPNTTIQSTQVSNDLTGLANGSNDTSTNSMSTFRSEAFFDYVASGCVWSGDSYAVTRNASQTSGVVYISGVRLSVASVSGRAFTASKDTYVDVNGSGVQVYTEVTNNAASPALTAGNIRIGIIITGATTIANSGSVNQGQETIILPIASSIPYTVTDSLGNLICTRDPNHKLLGYRQVTSDQSLSSAVQTQITGLSCPVIIPSNRKIKITVMDGTSTNPAGGAQNGFTFTLWDGTVGSGTQLNAASFLSSAAAAGAEGTPIYIEHITTPSATSKTYNVGFATQGVGGGTVHTNATSTVPVFIKVEIE